MSLLHHHGHRVPFEEEPPPANAAEEVGRLRRKLYHLEDKLAAVTLERDLLRHELEHKRWWWPW